MSIRRIPLNVERLPDKISLGRGSENEAVQLAVDVSAWVNAWPVCSISINFLRPYEDIFYTVSGTLDGGLYTYEVTDTDTAIAGTGTLELVCTEDGKLAASAVARFVVEERLLGTQSPTPPEPVQSWYTRALQAADDAEDAADRAETAAVSIESINPRVTALEHIVETSEQTAWNQLNTNSGATSTASGVTFTNNGDGTWTVTGNGSAAVRKQISAVEMVVGHVYAVLNGGIDTSEMNAYVCVTKNGSSIKVFNTENLFTADNDYNQFNLRTLADFSAPEGGLEFAPMLIDLTAIYGAGNEPSTIAEFRAKYPHRVYPYAAIGSTRNLDITEVHGAELLGKVSIQQNPADSGKVLGIGADGKVVPFVGLPKFLTTFTVTEEWLGTVGTAYAYVELDHAVHHYYAVIRVPDSATITGQMNFYFGFGKNNNERIFACPFCFNSSTQFPVFIESVGFGGVLYVTGVKNATGANVQAGVGFSNNSIDYSVIHMHTYASPTVPIGTQIDFYEAM